MVDGWVGGGLDVLGRWVIASALSPVDGGLLDGVKWLEAGRPDERC